MGMVFRTVSVGIRSLVTTDTTHDIEHYYHVRNNQKKISVKLFKTNVAILQIHVYSYTELQDATISTCYVLAVYGIVVYGAV